jgi:hypothetical protein
MGLGYVAGTQQVRRKTMLYEELIQRPRLQGIVGFYSCT